MPDTHSDWTKFAVQISKDEALTPLLTVGLLFIFVHLSHVHLATLKIHSISQTPPNFKQKTSPEVVNNTVNDRLLAGCYWAVWGCTLRQKSGRWQTVTACFFSLPHNPRPPGSGQPADAPCHCLLLPVMFFVQGCRSFILWNLNCKFGSVAYPNKLRELHLRRFKLDVLQYVIQTKNKGMFRM